MKASVPHFRHLSEGVPEGKEIVMHGGGGLAPLAQQPPAAEPLIPVRRKRSKMLGISHVAAVRNTRHVAVLSFGRL